ncbi:MAG: sigma-70 family RNA polymerase sigma factor [Planctomycetota bacterium]
MSETVPPHHYGPDTQPPDAKYMALVTGAQSSLYAFICSLLGNSENARDVLQNTNLVIWEKSAEFDRARPFKPWAFQIAYLQVMAFRKSRSRDRLVFDDAFMQDIAQDIARRNEQLEERLQALDLCIQRLPKHHQQIIRKRYAMGMGVQDIAEQAGQKANTLAVLLYRVRKALARCVENAAPQGGRP